MILQPHSQTISPNTVLYQHSPSDSTEYHPHQQSAESESQVQHHTHTHQHQSDHVDNKYSDNVNGHDTLTDFVTFVCQEAENSPQSTQVTIDRWLNSEHVILCTISIAADTMHHTLKQSKVTLLTIQFNASTATVTTNGSTSSHYSINR